VHLTFFNDKGERLETAELPPLTTGQRRGVTCMRYAQALGLVPPTAVSAKITVETPRRGGTHGGFADNIVLILQN
jgi:hypothetical protein